MARRYTSKIIKMAKGGMSKAEKGEVKALQQEQRAAVQAARAEGASRADINAMKASNTAALREAKTFLRQEGSQSLANRVSAVEPAPTPMSARDVRQQNSELLGRTAQEMANTLGVPVINSRGRTVAPTASLPSQTVEPLQLTDAQRGAMFTAGPYLNEADRPQAMPMSQAQENELMAELNAARASGFIRPAAQTRVQDDSEQPRPEVRLVTLAEAREEQNKPKANAQSLANRLSQPILDGGNIVFPKTFTIDQIVNVKRELRSQISDLKEESQDLVAQRDRLRSQMRPVGGFNGIYGISADSTSFTGTRAQERQLADLDRRINAIGTVTQPDVQQSFWLAGANPQYSGTLGNLTQALNATNEKINKLEAPVRERERVELAQANTYHQSEIRAIKDYGKRLGLSDAEIKQIVRQENISNKKEIRNLENLQKQPGYQALPTVSRDPSEQEFGEFLTQFADVPDVQELINRYTTELPEALRTDEGVQTFVRDMYNQDVAAGRVNPAEIFGTFRVNEQDLNSFLNFVSNTPAMQEQIAYYRDQLPLDLRTEGGLNSFVRNVYDQAVQNGSIEPYKIQENAIFTNRGFADEIPKASRNLDWGLEFQNEYGVPLTFKDGKTSIGMDPYKVGIAIETQKPNGKFQVTKKFHEGYESPRSAPQIISYLNAIKKEGDNPSLSNDAKLIRTLDDGTQIFSDVITTGIKGNVQGTFARSPDGGLEMLGAANNVTPTGGGGFWKKIGGLALGALASFAAPYLAPGIASALGTSQVVSQALASGVLSGAASAATGGDFARGFLGGGLGSLAGGAVGGLESVRGLADTFDNFNLASALSSGAGNLVNAGIQSDFDPRRTLGAGLGSFVGAGIGGVPNVPLANARFPFSPNVQNALAASGAGLTNALITSGGDLNAALQAAALSGASSYIPTTLTGQLIDQGVPRPLAGPTAGGLTTYLLSSMMGDPAAAERALTSGLFNYLSPYTQGALQNMFSTMPGINTIPGLGPAQRPAAGGVQPAATQQVAETQPGYMTYNPFA